MRQAVIVSTARTPLTKSHRGEFNITPGPTLASFAVRAAVDRALELAGTRVDDSELAGLRAAAEADPANMDAQFAYAEAAFAGFTNRFRLYRKEVYEAELEAEDDDDIDPLMLVGKHKRAG